MTENKFALIDSSILMNYMAKNKFSLIDSNILIYAYDKDEKEKNPAAKKILERVFKEEISISLSTQNLSEFYYNVTKKINKPLNIIEAKEIISGLVSLSNIKIIKINEETILKAIDISLEYNLSYWDSLIASVMKENQIFTIITKNDKDFKKIPWLSVINPFVK